MKLSVKVLYLREGVDQLAGKMSLSAESTSGGPHKVDSITRIPGGYLVGYRTELFVIEAPQVKCAKVVDLDASPESPARALIPTPAPAQPAPSQPAVAAAVPPGVTVDGRGVFSRTSLVGPTAAPEGVTAAPESKPAEAPVHQMKRQERGRRVGPTGG